MDNQDFRSFPGQDFIERSEISSGSSNATRKSDVATGDSRLDSNFFF